MAAAEPVPLPDLLAACLRALERRMGARHVRIVRQIDRTAPEIRADRDLLRDVLDSLMAEAADATADGGRVRVCLKHSPAAIMISIKDQGTGIEDGASASEAEADTPARPGAPLSLAACRVAASALGANFFINTAPGRGTTYYLILPAPREPRPEVVPPSLPDERLGRE